MALVRSAPYSSSSPTNLGAINLTVFSEPYPLSATASRHPPPPPLSTYRSSSMKQNITDGQAKAHLPSQIHLLTSSLKQKQPDELPVVVNGGYVNATVAVAAEDAGNASPTEVRRRGNHLSPPSPSPSTESRKTSLNSLDFADMIQKQQESLHQIASQYQNQQSQSQSQLPSPPGSEDTTSSTTLPSSPPQPHQHRDHSLPNGCSNGSANHELKNGSAQNGTSNKKSVLAEMRGNSEKDTVVQMTLVPNGTTGCGDESNGLVQSRDSKDGCSSEGGEACPKKEWSNIRRLLSGVVLTILSAFFFSITTVIVKFVTDIKPSQMALFRYLGILVLSYPVVLESKESWFGENNWWWRLWMLLRGLSGCTSLFFRYSAVTYISLADTTIILLSMPVFVFIFARIFLGEQFGRYHVLALVLSLVGIAFASKIDILFKKDTIELINGTTSATTMAPFSTTMYPNGTSLPETHVTGSHSTTHQLVGSLYALGAMVIGSLVYIMVRKMRKTHQSVILFNFALISIVEMTLINYIFYDFKLPTTGYSAYLVTILAVLSFYGQMLLTKAIQIEEAGVVSVVRVSGEAFFAFVFQIIIFGEMPDIYTISGAILVLSSVFLLSFRKYVISLPEDAPLRKRFNFLTK